MLPVWPLHVVDSGDDDDGTVEVDNGPCWDGRVEIDDANGGIGVS